MPSERKKILIFYCKLFPSIIHPSAWFTMKIVFDLASVVFHLQNNQYLWILSQERQIFAFLCAHSIFIPKWIRKQQNSKLLKEYLNNLQLFPFLLFTDIRQMKNPEATHFLLFPKFIIINWKRLPNLCIQDTTKILNPSQMIWERYLFSNFPCLYAFSVL